MNSIIRRTPDDELHQVDQLILLKILQRQQQVWCRKALGEQVQVQVLETTKVVYV